MKYLLIVAALTTALVGCVEDGNYGRRTARADCDGYRTDNGRCVPVTRRAPETPN